jgi:hypothetical protein
MNGSPQSRRASGLFGSTALARLAGLALLGSAAALPHGAAAYAQSVPTGGSVSSGSASIATGSN